MGPSLKSIVYQPAKIAFTALGFIRRVFWKNNLPSLQDGKFAATWAIEHAIELNTGGIKGPIQMAEISRNKKWQLRAKILEESDLQEHKQMVVEVEGRLREVKENLKNEENAPDIPSKE